jgi:hypothetical protein
MLQDEAGVHDQPCIRMVGSEHKERRAVRCLSLGAEKCGSSPCALTKHLLERSSRGANGATADRL